MTTRNLPLELEGEGPLFLQIARGVMRDVRRGRLVPGQQLPGSRAWAEALGVHRNTVLYRLERVKTVTGYDLGDAETRFRLQLAICMNAIRTSREGGIERSVRERAAAAD